MLFSTIAAISTPRGKGGVAVIRISGADACAIADRIFRPLKGDLLSDHPTRSQVYGNLLSSDQKTVLDDGLVTYFKAPFSFTGEDVVEISCHGGEVITSMILSSVLSCGAVMAEPGEFSRRAFINGKLSLTAAEGIADLLDAKTESAALLSSKAARGRLSEHIHRISESLLSAASSLWAYLDYPEEDLQSLSDDELLLILEKIEAQCARLTDTYLIGRAVNAGVSAVIVGKPNVGKSTFFNALLGEDRAIVTDIAGTTRDVIEYPVKFGRVLLNLSDTAGVRELTGDTIEKIGIEKTFATLRDAELIFALFDSSRPLEEDDRIVLRSLQSVTDALVIPVLTKQDLPQAIGASDLDLKQPAAFFRFDGEMDFSALISRVEAHFISDEAAYREGEILVNARQQAGVLRCRELISEASLQIQNGYKDIASLTLESALASLLEIDGKSAGETILNEVFSRFCVGK